MMQTIYKGDSIRDARFLSSFYIFLMLYILFSQEAIERNMLTTTFINLILYLHI